MPLKKFRTLDDAARSLWLEPGDPRIWEGLVRRWRLHQFFGPKTAGPKPGVYRFRSIDEKQRAK